MAHAAVGGDDARAGDLALDARRRRKSPPSRMTKRLMATASITRSRRNGRRSARLSKLACARRPSFYCSRRSNGVPDAQACRLRGKMGKPGQPAEPDPARTGGGIRCFGHPAPNSFQLEMKEAPMRTTCLSILGRLAAAVSPASAAETLTVYTYESFTAEWGPGPQVEKAFEAECGCDLEIRLGRRRRRAAQPRQAGRRRRPRPTSCSASTPT